MFNYDKPSCIFPCMLLTRNHMIFLVQIGINKHLLICKSLKKFTRAYLFQIALEIMWLPLRIYRYCRDKLFVKQFFGVIVWEWKSKSRYAMNEPENQIFKSEIFKKRIWRCHVFYLNYGEVGKRRSSILEFLNDSLFHRWSCYLIFHSCQIVIHLCFARKAFF